MQATMSTIAFGGIPIAVFGDHGQLQPVLDSAVWSEKFMDFDKNDDFNKDAYYQTLNKYGKDKEYEDYRNDHETNKLNQNISENEHLNMFIANEHDNIEKLIENNHKYLSKREKDKLSNKEKEIRAFNIQKEFERNKLYLDENFYELRDTMR